MTQTTADVTYFDMGQQVLRCRMPHELRTQVAYHDWTFTLSQNRTCISSCFGLGRMVQTFVKHNNERPLVYFQEEISLDKFRQTELGDNI